MPKDVSDRGPEKEPLIDGFGRHISYLRISVTDRCDLRCTYCMAERMKFLPKIELLRLGELERLAGIFIGLGVTKIRLTGGEPLVRRNITELIGNIGAHLKDRSLRELTMTSNATQLARHAGALYEAGMRRINISLDTLDAEKYRRITRGGDLGKTLAGIEAAKQVGLEIKINSVALKDDNRAELPDLIAWAHGQGFDMTLIEVMPMGDLGNDYRDQFLPLTVMREDLEQRWVLVEETYRSGGPSRYVRVAETGGRLGFISPLTQNFCAGCNRVRLTCTGRLYFCLGQNSHLDLRKPLRDGLSDEEITVLIRNAMTQKPLQHDFVAAKDDNRPSVARHMSVTGG